MSEIVHGGETENRQLRLNLLQRKCMQRFIFGNNINCCPEITALLLRKTQASLCVTVAQSQTAHVFDFSYSDLYDKKKKSHKNATFMMYRLFAYYAVLFLLVWHSQHIYKCLTRAKKNVRSYLFRDRETF